MTLPGWTPPPDNHWACLDATIPEIREDIANVFKTFRSRGYTYFKMDGLYFGLQRGIRQDRNATAVSAFRLLLKTIREAVPDSILMACSEPFLPCIGLVDNARVSNDTSQYFRKNGEPRNAPVLCGEALESGMRNFFCVFSNPPLDFFLRNITFRFGKKNPPAEILQNPFT